jgi:hypothetical protein
MTTNEWKKIARILKEAYIELEKEALSKGIDIFSDLYKELQDKTRLKVLEKFGVSLDEYREMKEEIASAKKKEVNSKFNEIKTQIDQIKEEPKLSKEEVKEIAEEIAKKYIKEPIINNYTTNEIVKETTHEVRVEQPKIIETVRQIKEKYNDKPIRKEIQKLYDTINAIEIPKPLDGEQIKNELFDALKKNIEQEIDILGMPDFRKLAMGLQSQIDGIDVSWSSLTGTPTALLLDQTTPQTITNDIPLLSETRVIDEMHQLVDKTYVDGAVASLGIRFYMLSTASGVETYYNTQITPSAGAESSVTATDPADNDFIAGWISPASGSPTKLIAGVYDWDIFAEKTGAGNKVFRIYWTLVERKADNSEVVIGTSADSNLLGAKEKYIVPLTLSEDYTPTAGSRIVGKVYAHLESGVSAANIILYSEGNSDSHWEIPTNKEILDTIYVPYSGAIDNVDLGSHYIKGTSFVGMPLDPQGYMEYTLDGSDNITNVDWWDTSGKGTKLYTKVITWTSSNPTTITLKDELANKTMTTTIAYSGDDITNVTKVLT